MNGKIAIALGVAGVTCAFGAEAWAQESQPVASDTEAPYLRKEVPAPRSAFELGVNAAYTRPFGNLEGGRAAEDVARSGFGAGVDLGYRINPRWGIGVGTQFHESNAADELAEGTDVRGVATSIQGTFHFMPYQRIDPYLTAGTGYRLLWQRSELAGQDVLYHGFQLGKLQAGLDVRVSRDVAVGPFVGADLDMFVWNKPEGAGNNSIDDREVSTFLYGGVQGRFDIGGTREVRTQRVAVRPMPTPVQTTTYFQSEVPAPSREPLPPTDVALDADLAKACGINQPKAYFAFDSADLKVQQGGPLDRLATCVTEGPMRGRTLEVVGHTDPRGTDAYNQRLGSSRAQSVANYLTAHGLTGSRVITQSVGEQQAVGTNPQTWAYDRRVDIRLAK